MFSILQQSWVLLPFLLKRSFSFFSLENFLFLSLEYLKLFKSGAQKKSLCWCLSPLFIENVFGVLTSLSKFERDDTYFWWDISFKIRMLISYPWIQMIRMSFWISYPEFEWFIQSSFYLYHLHIFVWDNTYLLRIRIVIWYLWFEMILYRLFVR